MVSDPMDNSGNGSGATTPGTTTATTASERIRARRAKRARNHAGDQATLLDDIWDWAKSIIIGFLIFIVIRIFLIQTFTIISGSMENTLLIGDFLVLSKSAYGATVPFTNQRLPGYSAPRRNDIVVFRSHHEDPQIDLVKRLVGMPGDTLAMRDGVLFVNGARRDEPWIKHDSDQLDGADPRMDWEKSFLVDSVRAEPYFPTRDNWGPIVVPPDNYFMMGDNREWSLDSRYWGFVPRKDMLGRAVALYFSYDKAVPGNFFKHVRWGRIATRLH
jgi:signal peptidase I